MNEKAIEVRWVIEARRIYAQARIDARRYFVRFPGVPFVPTALALTTLAAASARVRAIAHASPINRYRKSEDEKIIIVSSPGGNERLRREFLRKGRPGLER